MSEIVERAMNVAAHAHGAINQRRKYTDEPYINHPAAVVAILREHGIEDEDTLAAAWLHDVVEDCPVETSELYALFGEKIGRMVESLTDSPTEKGGPNRRARKAMDRDRLAAADASAQNIKVADMIDNTRTIVDRDPNFAVVYMREKRALLEVLTKADRGLLDRAWRGVREYEGAHA